MQYLLEVSEKKTLTKYYYVSKEGTIYKISNSSNGCDDAKQLTDNDDVYITITYEKTDSDGKATTYNSYIYLDSYIEEGDYWNVNEHKIKPHSCSNITFDSLAAKYKADAVEYNIKRMVERGVSKDYIISALPKYFLFDKSPIIISDSLKITDVSPNVYIDIANFGTEVEKYAKQEAEEAANEILTVINKKVDELTMTTKLI